MTFDPRHILLGWQNPDKQDGHTWGEEERMIVIVLIYLQRRNFLLSFIPLYYDYYLLSKGKHFNPLKTKRRLHYLKAQFVLRSKHFSSRL